MNAEQALLTQTLGFGTNLWLEAPWSGLGLVGEFIVRGQTCAQGRGKGKHKDLTMNHDDDGGFDEMDDQGGKGLHKLQRHVCSRITSQDQTQTRIRSLTVTMIAIAKLTLTSNEFLALILCLLPRLHPKNHPTKNCCLLKSPGQKRICVDRPLRGPTHSPGFSSLWPYPFAKAEA